MDGVETTGDDALTVEAAARLLGIAEKTLYKWASEGRVPSYKMGSRRLFVRAALIEWRDGQLRGGG